MISYDRCTLVHDKSTTFDFGAQIVTFTVIHTLGTITVQFLTNISSRREVNELVLQFLGML